MSSSECPRSQLITAGFQPKRFGFAVKLVRRLIWPFIRPFHFFHLDKMDDFKRHIQQTLFNPLIKDVLFLRAEVAALKHKIIASSQLTPKATSSDLFLKATKYGLFIGKSQEMISDSIVEKDVWDDHIIKLAQKVASARRGTAIDFGAHFGSTMLAFSSIFDHVHSFEPNDFNFRILRANVALNNLQNVSLYNQETEYGSGKFNHLAKTLDNYEFNNIIFIKIDVRSADGEVLMGALETIRRCQPVIVFENVSYETIRNKLSQLDYEISVLKTHNEKQIDYVACPKTAEKEL